jgi:hypothetical protein
MPGPMFGGALGAMGNVASGGTDLSASGRAGGRVEGLGRVDRTANAGAQEAARDARHAKAAAATASRQTVDAGESEASKASNAALATARAAARTGAATSVTAAGQGQAQARNSDAGGAVAAGVAVAESSGAKADNSKALSGQPVAMPKPGVSASRGSRPRHAIVCCLHPRVQARALLPRRLVAHSRRNRCKCLRLGECVCDALTASANGPHEPAGHWRPAVLLTGGATVPRARRCECGPRRTSPTRGVANTYGGGRRGAPKILGQTCPSCAPKEGPRRRWPEKPRP